MCLLLRTKFPARFSDADASAQDLTTYGDANYWKISNDWLESRGCMASSASN